VPRNSCDRKVVARIRRGAVGLSQTRTSFHILDPVFVNDMERAELRDRVRQMIVEEVGRMRAAEAAPAY
jgi:hypothetical protein